MVRLTILVNFDCDDWIDKIIKINKRYQLTVFHKMKLILFFILTVTFVNTTYAQKIANDTLYAKNALKTNWGFKVEVGGLFHHQSNKEYIANKINGNAGFSIYYKEFSLSYDGFAFDFYPKKEIHFGNRVFNSNADFSLFNMNFLLGYHFNFSKNWSSNFNVGINTTSFEIVNQEKIHQNFKTKNITGANIGIGLDRYFKLKGFRYLVLSLGINYYSTNYNSVSNDLSGSAMNYSLKAGYKFWCCKKLKSKTYNQNINL